MNKLMPYLKAIVSLIGPGYAAYQLAVTQHPGQNWSIVGAATLSSLLVLIVPNLPKIEQQIAAEEKALDTSNVKVVPPSTTTGAAS